MRHAASLTTTVLDWLRALLRSVLTLALLIGGALLAALLAAFALIAGLALGLALWLRVRFGPRVSAPPGPGHEAGTVIDVEMRELGQPEQPQPPRRTGG